VNGVSPDFVYTLIQGSYNWPRSDRILPQKTGKSAFLNEVDSWTYNIVCWEREGRYHILWYIELMPFWLSTDKYSNITNVNTVGIPLIKSMALTACDDMVDFHWISFILKIYDGIYYLKTFSTWDFPVWNYSVFLSRWTE